MNHNNICGAWVFITGASGGIGAACAERFASKGANLVLSARRKTNIDIIAQQLEKQYSVRVITLEMDVRDKQQVYNAINSLQGIKDQISLLINNAGLAVGLEKLIDGDTEDWDVMLDTNVKGLLYVSKAILPMIVDNSGQVINIGSIAGVYPYANGAVYCASKAAVRFITEALRMEMIDKAIKITNIQPGMVETEFSKVRFKGDAERANSVYEGIKPLVADDIADIVLYAATTPAHVQICEITVTPVHQAPGGGVHKAKV